MRTLLGERIGMLRLSYVEVARRTEALGLKVSASYVARVEKGQAWPTPERWDVLLAALELTPAQFFRCCAGDPWPRKAPGSRSQ